MIVRCLDPFAYSTPDGVVHVSRVGAVVDVPDEVAARLRSKLEPAEALPDDSDEELAAEQFDDVEWPSPDDPKAVWVEFATLKGVKRSTAQGMSKTNLVKTLDRMEGEE